MDGLKTIIYYLSLSIRNYYDLVYAFIMVQIIYRIYVFLIVILLIFTFPIILKNFINIARCKKVCNNHLTIAFPDSKSKLVFFIWIYFYQKPFLYVYSIFFDLWWNKYANVSKNIKIIKICLFFFRCMLYHIIGFDYTFLKWFCIFLLSLDDVEYLYDDEDEIRIYWRYRFYTIMQIEAEWLIECGHVLLEEDFNKDSKSD